MVCEVDLGRELSGTGVKLCTSWQQTLVVGTPNIVHNTVSTHVACDLVDARHIGETLAWDK